VTSQTLISVIIPAYNAGAFLGDAIECVREQHYEPLEVIVIDDGSTDNTFEIAASFGNWVQIIRQENQGPAAARNSGLRLAQGNIIAFLDADDLWPAGTLKMLASQLAAHPDLDVILGRVQYLCQVAAPGEARRFEPFSEPCISMSLDAGLFRRSAFDRVGCFNAATRSGEDVDWFMRAREQQVRLKVLSEVTLFYRRHGRNMTRARESIHADFVRVLKRSLDRRRNTNTLESLPPMSADADSR